MAARQIGIAPFGATTRGEAVSRITLGQGDLSVSILTWGAVLQGVWLAGVPRNLTLGSDRLSDYEGDMRYHGSLIGPVVNRLTGTKAKYQRQLTESIKRARFLAMLPYSDQHKV